MSNNVSFTGRLGRDSELKSVGEGSVLKFTVANNTGFGEKKATNWFNCDMWGTRGAKIEQYLIKGTQVFVTGELTLRKYTGKDGSEKLSPDVRVSEIELLGQCEEKTSAAPKQEESSADMPF